MKLTYLLVGLVISLASLAQMPGNRSGGQMPTGRFYGKVVDAANKGIEAASVVLVQEKLDTATKKRKEVIVGGMLTAANGDFNVENVPVMGRYKLRITGIGYKIFEQNVNFEMPNRNGNTDPSAMLSAIDKDLGNIKLEIDNQVLADVTVSASKPLLTMGIDRKVFNVDKNIVSAGGTAVDIMRNVPSLNVDIDGNVSLRNSSPQIFVDGRPTTLTLDQIPADAIESVEIITNPSAKFDASGGTAGILNIVMKKQRRVGYAGNVRANIDSRARAGIGADINVRQDKVNFFLSGNINQRRSLGEGITDRITLGTVNSKLYQSDESEFNGLMGFGRAGIDYFINNRNTLTLTGSMFRGQMDPYSSSNIFTDSTNNGTYDILQDRISDGENDFRNFGTQLGYKHNFPKAGHEWTADITFNRGKNNRESFIGTDYYSMSPKNFIRSYDQLQRSNGTNEFMVFQTDYAKPLNDRSKLEVGARMQIRNVDNYQEFRMIDNGVEMVIPNQEDVLYNSTDKIYAAYGNYSSKIKNFGFQLGLRAESSDYEGNLLSKAQQFNIEFPISLFPSIFLSQKINDRNDIQLNYSRRINRPNFWQLLPFTDYSDSLNINRGNPNLNPEFTNSIELSYNKQFENRDNLMASIYFKNTNDLITRFQTRDTLNEKLLINSFINANRSYVTGLELIGRNKITKFWDLTTNANFFTSKIELEDQPDSDQFLSYFLKINNNFKLPKNFTVQLSGDYTSKIISSPGGTGGGRGGGMHFGGGSTSAAQGYISPNYGVDAAVRFEFLKNKTATLSLNVNDIFRTKKYDSYSESPFFIQNVERRRDAQVFRLNFNYRFGKFDASLFKRKNTRSEDVQMDMGGM